MFLQHCDACVVSIVFQNLSERARLKNLTSLSERYQTFGVAAVDVPGDGNCLAWSLRMLHMGFKYCLKKRQHSTAMDEMRRVRKMISDAWVGVKHEPLWQRLFAYFVDGREAPQTPKRSKKAKETDPNDVCELATPPRVPVHVSTAKPIPLSQKAAPASPSMKQPGPKKKKRRGFLEPEVPDIEQLFAEDVGKTNDLNEVKVEDVDEAMLEGDDEGKARKRVRHERRFKCRVKSETEIRLEDVGAWLATHELDYGSFNSIHRQLALVKKGFHCHGGGFRRFKELLIAGQVPECKGCLACLERKQVTLEDVSNFLSKGSVDKEATGESGEKPQQPSETPVPNVPSNVQSENAPLTKREESIQYLKSFAPTIEFHEDAKGIWFYRCKICVTRNQPLGKVNKLPSQEPKSVKFFLQQHLNCPSHINKVKQVHRVALETTSTDCPGLCINDCEAISNLGNYFDEYKTWATFTKLDTNVAKHSYWCSLSDDKWWVRHKDCEKTFVQPVHPKEPEETPAKCCSKCSELALPQAIQKRVVRFASKTYAARLLQKRLFFSENEAKEFEDSIDKSVFGINNKKFWQNLKKLTNGELQSYVKRTWKSIPPSTHTPQLENFLSTVVHPATEVHASAVKSNLVCLSSQFVEALMGNQQSAACHC